MERGPLALFGAIVAVGLGPALWLGAQFGRFDVQPARPPVAVDQTHADTAQLLGGSGAGEKQTGDNTTIRTTPRAHVMPLTKSPSPSPSASDADPSAAPSASTSASASNPGPSDDPSTTPPGSTAPTESTGSGGNDSQPPSPPADGGSGGGNGSGGGSGSGGGGGSPNAAKVGQA